MATAIPELIAQVIQTRLQQITTANGYETNVSEVVRPTRDDKSQPKDNQIFLTNGDDSRAEEFDCQGNPPAFAYRQEYEVNSVIRPSEKATTPSAKLQATLRSDILKAITAYTAWWQMGGNAIQTEFGSITNYNAPDGSALGVRISLNVIYRCDSTNPYNVRG